MNFFDSDVSEELEILKDRFKEAADLIAGVQNKINRLDNLTAYQTHNEDEEIKLIINKLINQSLRYVDIDQKSLISGFKDNYLSRVFELAMYRFLKDTHGFNLCERAESDKNPNQSTPDYIFTHGSNLHQFECVTRTSSLMDQFFKILPDFSLYLKVARLLNKKHDDFFKSYGSSYGNTFWETSIDMLFTNLESNDQEKIKNLLRSENINIAQVKFKNWVYIIRYACLNFSDLLNSTILIELKKINFPAGLCGDQTQDKKTEEHLVYCIAQAIIDKSRKEYSAIPEKPVTIAISCALMRNLLSIPSPLNLMNLVKQNLGKIIKNKILDKNIMLKVDSVKNNIYAIIIDTCWYNWFPKIAVKRHGAKFPDGYNNYYACLYNSTHPLVKDGVLIYNKIPTMHIDNFTW